MKNKSKKVIFITIGIIFIFVIIVIAVYLGTYSHSDPFVKQYLQSSEDVKVTNIKDGYYFDRSW